MRCKICNGKLQTWYKDLFDDRHGYPGKFDIKKCNNCGFGQTIPQLSPKKISKIYEKYYPWKNTNISNIKRSDFKIPNKFTIWRKGLFINGQYLVKPRSTVLDIGCGLGHSLLELESIKCKAYGIDPDKNTLKLAKKFGLNFKVAFIEDQPFKDLKFDYIIANQVLEHTNDPISFLNESSKRLKKDGKIILSFPNVNSLTRLLFDINWLHFHIPYHLNFFTRASLKIMCKKLGLKINRFRTETPNMWTNLQIRRLLQKPKMGVRDPFWDGKVKKGEVYSSGFFPKIVHFLEEYNIFNRFVDLIGLGESFTVTLQKV